MTKKIVLFLVFILSMSFLGGCGNKKSASDETEENTLQTDYRFEQCGLAYQLPKDWLSRENVNLIPVTYVKPEGEIYAKIEYDYAPDENMEELNNPDSEIPVDELMIPVFTLLVVKNEMVDSAGVTEELGLYKNVEELPSQEGFRFYYLTEYTGSTARFSQSAQKVFDTLQSELPLLRETIETFVPDESTVQAQLEQDKEYLNFMSTTLAGDPVTSTMFYDYDLTVVNFWASYCYPDINELGTLQAFSEELKKSYPNINFVQVVIDTPREAAEKTVEKAYQEAGVTFTSIIPDEAMASWIIENLNGLPTTIFVDNTGKPFPTKLEGIKTLEEYLEATVEMLEKTAASE